MYNVGDFIIYGNSGVCKITAVGKPEVSSLDKNKCYYTLTPVYGTGVIYIPTDTKVFMRPVISKKEAEQLIKQIPSIREEVIENNNFQFLTERYRTSFQSHECIDLVKLIKTVYTKNQTAKKFGKKPGLTDEKFMKRAEDLLYGELAVALGIPIESVPDYIKEQMEKPV